MKNWIGQDIILDDIVYRGARQGNSSSFMIGRVIGLNEEKQTVRVRWILEQFMDWKTREVIPRKLSSNRYGGGKVIGRATVGSPTVHSVVLIDLPPEILLEFEAAENEVVSKEGQVLKTY